MLVWKNNLYVMSTDAASFPRSAWTPPEKYNTRWKLAPHSLLGKFRFGHSFSLQRYVYLYICVVSICLLYVTIVNINSVEKFVFFTGISNSSLTKKKKSWLILKFYGALSCITWSSSADVFVMERVQMLSCDLSMEFWSCVKWLKAVEKK